MLGPSKPEMPTHRDVLHEIARPIVWAVWETITNIERFFTELGWSDPVLASWL